MEKFSGIDVYLPVPVTIAQVAPETEDTFTLHLKPAEGTAFSTEEYGPGKFLQVTAFGVGEAPVSIAGVDNEKEELLITVRRTGSVTGALCNLGQGGVLGIRGPYGNGFPLSSMEGKNLVLIGGGVGLPPLRHLVETLSRRRGRFGSVRLCYGTGRPGELIYGKDLERICEQAEVELKIIVEFPDGDWCGGTGLVTDLLLDIEVGDSGSIAAICGPEPMMKAAAGRLSSFGMRAEDIYCSLERQMRCGVGKCGHCCVGQKYVCTDGPVFNYSDLELLLEAERG